MESIKLSANGLGEVCVREGCRKTRAKNPRTGAAHDHCSIKCMQADRHRDREASQREEVFVDYQMDLLRALEMSRLQFLREMGQLRPGSSTSQQSPLSPQRPIDQPENSSTTDPDGPTPSISSLILQDASLTPLSRPTLSQPPQTLTTSPLNLPSPLQTLPSSLQTLPSPPQTLPEVDSAASALTALVGGEIGGSGSMGADGTTIKTEAEVLMVESGGEGRKKEEGRKGGRSEGRKQRTKVKIPVENVDLSAASDTASDQPVRRGRVLSEPGHRSRAQTTGSSTDTDLQRAIEMSRLSLREEDRDLRLAIELSLKDSLSNQNLESSSDPPSLNQDPPLSLNNQSASSKKNQSKSDEEIHQQIQRNPEYSSIVQRVPNRSVEDLAAESDGSQAEEKGACGGVALGPPVKLGGEKGGGNMFGLIKDISVANINVGSEDKTKGFEDKRIAFMTDSASPSVKQYSSKGDNNLILAEAALEQSRFEPQGRGGTSRFGAPTTGNPARSDEVLVIEESPLPVSNVTPEVNQNVRFLTKRQNNEINKHPAPPTAAEIAAALGKQRNPDVAAARQKRAEVSGMKPEMKPFVIDPALNNAVSPSSSRGAADMSLNTGADDLELNPDDLHIDPDLLESMIQGAEEYHRNNIREEGGETVSPLQIRESRPHDLEIEGAEIGTQEAEQIQLLERTNQIAEEIQDGGLEMEEDEEGAVFV